MLMDVIEVKAIGEYRLFLRFEDGKSGIVDLSKLIKFDGIFKPLLDYTYFSKVKLSAELGTIYWENGADMAPETLYKSIS